MIMKVYFHGKSQNHMIYVTPAEHYPDVREWREINGRPKMFEVHFKFGVAEVDDKLGEYMVEKELASATKIITNLHGAA